MKLAVSAIVMRVVASLDRQLWFTRAVTFGVRAIVTDGERVCLVRHIYLPGWYLPGGGVSIGEAAQAAAEREVREEAALRCLQPPTLHGLFRNGRRDHVACFVIRDFEPIIGAVPDRREIAEIGFFPLDALPAEATRATRARLAELRGSSPLPLDW